MDLGSEMMEASTTASMPRRLCMSDIQRLRALHKSFSVLFLPNWALREHAALVRTTCVRHTAAAETDWHTERARDSQSLFQVVVEANSAEEEFCVDCLAVKVLPHLAIFHSDGSVTGTHSSVSDHGSGIRSADYWDLTLESFYNSIEMDRNTGYSERNGERDNLNIYDASLSRDKVFRCLFGDGDGACFENEMFGMSRSLPVVPIRLFISGDRSSVGKTSTCLALLSALVGSGISPDKLAYIKPATQCEAEQPIARYCNEVGIDNRCIGPVVFYSGFTRAYLAGETDNAETMLRNIVKSVESIEKGKHLVVIDGVGYPSVGSICNVSNGHVAAALQAPVVLVGKSGVGDAVDSYNLNAAYFESFGVKVLGGIFNKIELEGFYNLHACKEAVSQYFLQFKPSQMPFGFVPKVSNDSFAISQSTTECIFEGEEKLSGWTRTFLENVDLSRLIYYAWIANILGGSGPSQSSISVQPPLQIESTLIKLSGTKRSRDQVQEEARQKGAQGG